MLSFLELHGVLLAPLQITPDRRTEFPVEDDQTLCRAWDLISAFTTASTASLQSRPGDFSPELSAAAIGHYHPDLLAQARAAALHCSFANSSLEYPACNWEIVRMA